MGTLQSLLICPGLQLRTGLTLSLCVLAFLVCVLNKRPHKGWQLSFLVFWILLALVLVFVISYCQKSERLALAFVRCVVVQLCLPGCPVSRSSWGLIALQKLTEQVWGGA